MTDHAGVYSRVVRVVVFVGLLWIIAIADFLLGMDLYRYGVYPRHWSGLAGILFAPVIHGSFGHLLSNTLPLLVLGTAMLYGYPRASGRAIALIYLGAGAGVWLLGRSSFHVGASGLTLGMMVFIFLVGVVRWDPRAIALSCAVFFMYGGMLWGILPGDVTVSFEYHLSGAAMGVLAVWWLRNLDPKPEPKHYDWEDEQ